MRSRRTTTRARFISRASACGRCRESKGHSVPKNPAFFAFFAVKWFGELLQKNHFPATYSAYRSASFGPFSSPEEVEAGRTEQRRPRGFHRADDKSGGLVSQASRFARHAQVGPDRRRPEKITGSAKADFVLAFRALPFITVNCDHDQTSRSRGMSKTQNKPMKMNEPTDTDPSKRLHYPRSQLRPRAYAQGGLVTSTTTRVGGVP